MTARWMNVALGTWLFGSALVARPGGPEFADHITLGLAIFLLAFLAMGIPRLRWGSAALGVAVALSPLVFHYMAHWGFHDMVVGILVFWAATTPSREQHGPPVPPAVV